MNDRTLNVFFSLGVFCYEHISCQIDSYLLSLVSSITIIHPFYQMLNFILSSNLNYKKTKIL